MLTELCQELKNWWIHSKHTGSFTISNGGIAVDFLKPNQYYRIKGSIFNDGVHRYGEDNLADETFDGEVWGLAIPEEVIDLSTEIDEWRKKYEGADSAAMSPFMSETFGGYSYAKGSTNGNGQAQGADWSTVFAARLNKWRKI